MMKKKTLSSICQERSYWGKTSLIDKGYTRDNYLKWDMVT